MRPAPRTTAAQALRNQAMALRQLATRHDAMDEIGRLSAFRIGRAYFHNDDLLGAPDRGVAGVLIPPGCITPLELIDDACALEACADKLTR